MTEVPTLLLLAFILYNSCLGAPADLRNVKNIEERMQEPSESKTKELADLLKKIGPIGVDEGPPSDDPYKQNKRDGISDKLFEGDIIMPNKNSAIAGRSKRNAYTLGIKWPNGVVYYQISPEVQSRVIQMEMINKVHEFLHNNTCVRFQQSDIQPIRIVVKENNGCSSNIGMGTEIQKVSLAEDCGTLFGTITHEFMHTLGFLHTQNRKDRDDNVIIDMDNIDLPKPQKIRNFGKLEEWENYNYTPYEYGSTMHYPVDWGAKSGKMTMVPKDYQYLYSMGSGIVTFNDVKMINDHYDCHGKCVGSKLAACSNGGYPNPNNCQQCVCPPGYGGVFCERRPDGCGSELSAAPIWQFTWVKFGEDSTRLRNMFTECVHWIRAPAGKTIQARVKRFVGEQCNYGCQTLAVEFKIKDPTYAGPRVCCDKHTKMVFTSALNPMSVITYSRYAMANFGLEYRYGMFRTIKCM